MTRRIFLITYSFLFLLITLGCSGKSVTTTTATPPTLTTPLLIAGSGTNLPITRKLAEAYSAKTGIQIDIPGSIGSDGAINAVKNGSLELGLISKQLTNGDRDAGLKEYPYARAAVIFGAHIQVPNSNLYDADIIAIINGTKTTWSDGSRIHVFLRQNNDSSNLALYNVVPGYKEALLTAYKHQRWQIIYRDADMSQAIKDNKGAFGLTTSTETFKENGQTKSLHYNGISPTMENIRNGTYPLTEDLSFIYKEPLSNRARNFLDYVFSDEGQALLDKWGCIPIGR